MPVTINGSGLGSISAGSITGNLSGQAITVDNNSISNAKLQINSVVSNNIQDGSIGAADLNGQQTGGAPIYGCRAWVNFNGTVAANLGASYIRTATYTELDFGASITHEFIVNNKINVTFTSGGATSGNYSVVAVVDSQRIRINHTGTVVSGAATVNLRQIRAAGNVNYISYIGLGWYYINFAIPMPDANYAVTGVTNEVALGNRSSGWCIRGTDASLQLAEVAEIDVGSQSSGGAHDCSIVTVCVFR